MQVSADTIVIHDQEPRTFIIWLFLMCAVLLAYFVVTTIHDINRDAKLDEARKRLEDEKRKRDLEKI